MTQQSKVQSLINQAKKAGFESYGSFNEGELQHEIFTCLSGQYDGEVIDIYWKYKTGEVVKVEQCRQFSTQEPNFKFTQ